jgi:gamma-glutamylcyclotransferase (GGCT)/AIG2-like uncharacterized protein YtfP
MARDVRYFAYGTLQTAFPNHGAFADDLGAGLGRYRTVEPYPLVVPLQSACANPGCRFVHRMCALLPDAGTGLPVEGELFAVDPATIERLDRLESYRADDEAGSAYLRREVRVAPLDQDDEPVDAQVYFVAAVAAWRRLLERGEAEVVARYTKDLAVGPLKECCRREPGHPGPHDVIDLVSP